MYVYFRFRNANIQINRQQIFYNPKIVITFALGVVSCNLNHSRKEETSGSSLESGSQKTSTGQEQHTDLPALILNNDMK